MNNSSTVIEIVLIGVIILIQTFVGVKTRWKIANLKNLITNIESLVVFGFKVSLSDLKQMSPREILKTNVEDNKENIESEINSVGYEISELEERLNNLEDSYIFDDEGRFIAIDEDNENVKELRAEIRTKKLELGDLKQELAQLQNQKCENVDLIKSTEETSAIFDKIIYAINVYLLKNKGAATDFNLIKDITNRNIGIEEEDVSSSITVPLYLGLMGTMLGIVSGLMNMYFISNATNDSGGFEIKGFILAVSIAMIASFYGLLWTVINSNFGYKNAIRHLESQKNDFFTFIQVELLPLINQSVSSSVYDLHKNLVKFNDDFTGNINHLKGLLDKNHDALIAQDNILQALENIDITSFAKANVRVLQGLKESTDHLREFNQYLGSLENVSNNTLRLSDSFQVLLNRTNNFENLAEKIDSRVEESNNLVKFFNNHYQTLETQGTILENAVKDVDDVLVKSLEELRKHTNEKIDAIRQITEQEEDNMIKTFSENRSQIAKLSLLDNLSKAVDNINQNSSKKEIEDIYETLSQLTKEVNKTNRLLAEKHDNLIVSNLKKLFMKGKVKNEKE